MPVARNNRALGAALLMAATLVGCHDPAARDDFIDPTIGDAVAANKAMQIADPWPRQSFRRDGATDGGRAAKAIGDYRKGTETAGAGGGGAAAPSTR